MGVGNAGIFVCDAWLEVNRESCQEEKMEVKWVEQETSWNLQIQACIPEDWPKFVLVLAASHLCGIGVLQKQELFITELHTHTHTSLAQESNSELLLGWYGTAMATRWKTKSVIMNVNKEWLWLQFQAPNLLKDYFHPK